MNKLNNQRGGFTLIELMIVVAIIGILAAIAIPNFLRFQLKAKSSEGKVNLAAIRTAEHSYFAEYGGYVSSEPSPQATAANLKTNFFHPIPGAGFDQVGWQPEGDVYFNYQVTTLSPLNNEFLASAAADIDAAGPFQIWGYKTDGMTEDGQNHLNPSILCVAADLSIGETVMPCTTTSGQSVF